MPAQGKLSRGESAEPRIVGLVLAAGSSSRMGADRNKLLEPVGGRPLVAWPVEALRQAGVDPVLVVTGHASDALRSALAESGCRFLSHAGWQQGMGSSIAQGARQARELGAEGLLVCVGDLPGLRAAHVAKILEAFSGREAIIVPVHGGRRGHPVLFGAAFLAALTALEGDVGGRPVLESHPEAILEVEVGSDAVLRDVDTPTELARWPR